MINVSTITTALETILKDSLGEFDSENKKDGYVIERNPARNIDPNVASQGGGWIGIYRARVNYDPVSTAKWKATIEIDVELQVADFTEGNGAQAETQLQASELALMNVLNQNKTIGGTVDTTIAYSIEYEINADESEQGVYHNAAVITIRTESRTSI